MYGVRNIPLRRSPVPYCWLMNRGPSRRVPAALRRSRAVSAPIRSLVQPQAGQRSGYLHDTVVGAAMGIVVGLVSGGILVGYQLVEEDRRQQEAIRLENLRYVRDKSSEDPELGRFFESFDLEGQSLSGLRLAKAEFGDANLSGATMHSFHSPDGRFTGTVLRDVFATDSDFTKARFSLSDMRESNIDAVFDESIFFYVRAQGTDFGESTFIGAVMSCVDLRGADLGETDLTSARLVNVIHDSDTVWPPGFNPPESVDLIRKCGILIDESLFEYEG